MIAEFYGKKYNLEYLRDLCYITREGVSLLGISQAAERIGFRTLMVRTDLNTLIDDCIFPAIVHWNSEHFTVLYHVKDKSKHDQSNIIDKRFTLGDPAFGIVRLNGEEFLKSWDPTESGKGVVLLLEPTADFYKAEPASFRKAGFSLLLNYLTPYKKGLLILLAYMVSITLITISFPYLTKGMIDQGVMKKSYNIVFLFAVSQFLLFVGSTMFDILRSRLLQNINAKISLSIVSDFLKKLLHLPIRFFDSKSVGDISQRISDHHRIESFLTGDLISAVFSLLNIVIFSSILLYYKASIWFVFVFLSIVGVLWIVRFNNTRKKLDYIRFSRSKLSQEKLYELIVGMQEVKLYGSETSNRWELSEECES
jgi:ATP-binding cassette subfamily B protein